MDDLFHGHGKKFYHDGGTYEGEWVFGEKHGRGKAVNYRGEVFEGWYEYGRYQSRLWGSDPT